MMQSVVKVFVKKCRPDFSLPWQQRAQTSSTGSGFAISQQRILTNAHVVADQKSVRVRKHADPKKYTARVIHVGHECDIAVLKVDDEKFWAEVEPLEFGGIPNIDDEISVIGFPTGGDNISVTRGVVSRVDVRTYSHGNWCLLAIQVDAAINSGNSGGPAVKDGHVIGIAFQSMKEAENIGRIIPIPVVEHFLQDIERNGGYSGFCDIGIREQSIENSHMRKFMKMGDNETGVLVTRVQKTWSSYGKIQRGDVLMAFNGIELADDGTVPFRGKERISWGHLIDMTFPGETVTATVLRDGEKMFVEIKAEVPPKFIPKRLFDVQPSYVVYSGLVFTCLSIPYMVHRFGTDWLSVGPTRLRDIIYNELQETKDQHVVILSQVLASELTSGYENISNRRLFRVNGINILNLDHLCQVLDEITSPINEKQSSKSSGENDQKPTQEPKPKVNQDTKTELQEEMNDDGKQDIQIPSTPRETEQDKLVLNNEEGMSGTFTSNSANSSFVHFEVEHDNVIVLGLEEVRQKSGEILSHHGIASPRSDDLPQQMF